LTKETLAWTKTTLSQKNAQPSSDVNIITNFHNSFTARKPVKFPTKQCVLLPTTPTICCHTTL